MDPVDSNQPSDLPGAAQSIKHCACFLWSRLLFFSLVIQAYKTNPRFFCSSVRVYFLTVLKLMEYQLLICFRFVQFIWLINYWSQYWAMIPNVSYTYAEQTKSLNKQLFWCLLKLTKISFSHKHREVVQKWRQFSRTIFLHAVCVAAWVNEGTFLTYRQGGTHKHVHFHTLNI